MLLRDPTTVARYLARRTSVLPEALHAPGGLVAGIGWVDRGGMKAALGIEEFDGDQVWVHVAVEIPARQWVVAATDLVFNKFNAELASMWIDDANKPCMRLMAALGAHHEHTRPRSRSGVVMHLFSLRRGTGIHRRLVEAGKLP